MARSRVVVAGVWLGTGLAVALLNTFVLLDRHASTSSRVLSTLAVVLFGMPSLAIGSKLAFDEQKEAKQTHDRLQTIFYDLLKSNQGKISVLQLAATAKISGTEAKALLDDRAKEFNARFEVSEGGEILYYFPFDADSNTSKTAPDTYDVILEQPTDGWNTPFWGASILEEVEEKITHDLPAEVRKQIKSGKYPATLAKGLSKEAAKKIQRKLGSSSRLYVEVQPAADS